MAKLHGGDVEVEAGVEFVGILGVDEKGPFQASIAAIGAGVEVEGVAGQSAYVAAFKGVEKVSHTPGLDWPGTVEHESIILVEGGFGPAVAGFYHTGGSSFATTTGVYLGVRAGPVAGGIGFNLDALWCLMAWSGYMNC
jgi:hypothetical protein